MLARRPRASGARLARGLFLRGVPNPADAVAIAIARLLVLLEEVQRPALVGPLARAVVAQDLKSLSQLLTDRLMQIAGVDDVRSMIALEEIKPPSPVPVD